MKDPFDGDPNSMLNRIEAANYVWPEDIKQLSPEQLTRNFAAEEPERNNAGTLENLLSSMDENKIEYACALPIPRRVTFEDLLKVHNVNKRILPFTGVDFELGEGAYDKLLEDSNKGAYGIKLHPILQCRSMLSDDVKQAMEVWKVTKKPVIVHTFKCEYYPANEAKLYSNSDFGSNYEFLKLVELFPEVNFVGAHMGGSRYFEELLEGKDLKNLYVDSSLQPASSIERYIEEFGVDRVLYGSDWPWGYQAPTFRATKLACHGDVDLENKIFYQNAKKLLNLE